jgi:hypothetical protein
MAIKKTVGFLLLTAFLLMVCTVMYAQDEPNLPRVTVNYKQVQLKVLLPELEKQSGYRFFYDATLVDSIKVDISASNELLNKVLSTVFANTDLHFSVDGDKHIFITKEVLVKTTLPPDFFNEAKTKTGASDSVVYFGEKEKVIPPATLENKLYIIGLPNARNTKPRVAITGYVHDAKTGEPVAGATISSATGVTPVVTDQFGYYALSLPRGRHTINIKSLGMRNTKRQLMANDDGGLNIDLQSEVITLSAVTVRTDKTNQVRNMQMGLQRIDVKTLKQVPVVFGEADVLRVVLTLPGVKSVGEASTGLNVRGGAADQNLILLNDATVYNPSHMFGLFSAFNAETIKDIQLYKSGIPVKYGGRLSSVLEVNMREGNKKEYTGSAGVGLITSRFNIEGPIKKDKSSFIFGGRTTYANWMLKLLPDEYKNSRGSFYDINFSTSHELDKKNNLYFTGYISNDRFNLNNDTSYNYGNRNFSAKWKHVYNNRWYSLVTAGIDHYQYGIESSKDSAKAYKLAFDINQVYFKTHVNYFANSKHTFEFGFNSILYKIHPGSYQPLGRSTIVPIDIEAEQALENALYISDKFTISEPFGIEAGIRYSLFSYLGAKTINTYLPGVPLTENTQTGSVKYNSGAFIKTYQAPELRIAARYVFMNDMSIKASINTQRQYIQSLSNTTAMAPTDIWKLSDPNIKPQSGIQYSLGLYKNFRQGMYETSLEVYYKQMDGFLDYKSGATLVLNKHIETDVVSTKGKAYGLELLLKKTTGKLNGWISYSFSRTLLQMKDSTQGDPVNKGAFYPANYDKPHDITIAANYRISHRYSFSWNATYSTGRPITLPIGRFDYAGGGRTLYADRNDNRIPDYFRMDFALTLDGNHKVNQTFHNSFTFGAYNLTGRKNPYSVYYVSERGAINGYKLSIFGSIIPYLNYNIRF